MFELEEQNSLLSLLGLLNFSEYFVTVDHSILWQRHIAWAKPKGAELRQYITQRYASNMVFLSCMLAAQINVFFNSSRELTNMRSLLGSKSHDSLRYWIGVTILMDVSTTIIALVTTFTLWGMVSSISDANTHALLRSSIGQYVTSLPSRFTVSALYLFLLWIVLFIIDLLVGPVQIFLVLLVLVMFFQVVIPISAFGRLIIHTGAMAKRPVLDKELEKELLPSGLHTSLLIRATDRRRKYSSATDQYRKQNRGSDRGEFTNGTTASAAASGSVPSSSQAPSSRPPTTFHLPKNIAFSTPKAESDDLTLDGSVASLAMNDEEAGMKRIPERTARGHRRMETADTVGSDNFFFPGASVLNATVSRREIKDVVEKSVQWSTMGADNPTSSTPREGLNRNDSDALSDGRFWPASSSPDTHQARIGADGVDDPRQTVTGGATFQHSDYFAGDRLTNTLDFGQNGSNRMIPSGGGDGPLFSPGRNHVPPHPLLASPPIHPNSQSQRPPRRNHHRRRSSANRRSTGSLLGFIPLPSPAEELEEENEVRAMFDISPATGIGATDAIEHEITFAPAPPPPAPAPPPPRQTTRIPSRSYGLTSPSDVHETTHHAAPTTTAAAAVRTTEIDQKDGVDIKVDDKAISHQPSSSSSQETKHLLADSWPQKRYTS